MKVFIGYDPNEPVAYYVLAHSIMRHATRPVSITPLALHQLPMTRARDPRQSTEFSFSRFLVPYLCSYEGYAVFMDSDMLCRADITELLAGIDPNDAVSVVKHDYVPSTETKFLDNEQAKYKRKNWSSLMVFNNAKCMALTPAYVNTASGMQLHQFQWMADDLIGDIDVAWNHLVTEYQPNPWAKLVHYTLGTPCFAKYSECEFAKEWRKELYLMTYHNRLGEYSLPERVTA